MGEGSVVYLGSTFYAEWAQGSAEEGEGCLYKFPVGEKVYLGLQNPALIGCCEIWGKVLKLSAHLTCKMRK